MAIVINLSAGYGQPDPVVTARADTSFGGRQRILVEIGPDVVIDLPAGTAESLCDALCGVMAQVADPPVVSAAG